MIRSAKKQENVIPNQGKQKQSIGMEIGKIIHIQEYSDVRISHKDIKTTIIMFKNIKME